MNSTLSTTCTHDNPVELTDGATCLVGHWCPYCGSIRIWKEWREPVFFTLSHAFERALLDIRVRSTGPAPAMPEQEAPPPVTNSVETPSDV